MASDAKTEAAESLAMRVGVSLAASVDAVSLMVETTIQNRTSGTFWVFDVLWDYAPTGALVHPPSEAYVCIQDGELRFAHRQLPYPSKPILVRITPNLTPVEPGAMHRRRMRFPIPVEEYSCFYPREPSSPVEIVVSKTARYFCDIAANATEGAFRPSPSLGGVEIANVNKLGTIVTLQSAAVPCVVKVERRLDDFERF